MYNHTISEVDGDDLTTRIIRRWRKDIAESPPRGRPRGGKIRYRAFDPKDPEQVRCRRATANTLFIYLRAALNRSWAEGSITSDMAWRRIEPFAEAAKPRTRYLEKAEVRSLLTAAPPALGKFLKGGIVSGARPSELMRLEVRDYHDPSGTLHVTISKTAHKRHIVLGEEGQNFIREICLGRKGTNLMFVREDGSPWTANNYREPTKSAATAAGLDDVTYYTLRHTYCSHSAMNGMALTVLAKNLGHVDTRMVEKHYGHLAPDYIAREIRAHAPSFGLEPSSDSGDAAG